MTKLAPHLTNFDFDVPIIDESSAHVSLVGHFGTLDRTQSTDFSFFICGGAGKFDGFNFFLPGPIADRTGSR